MPDRYDEALEKLSDDEFEAELNAIRVILGALKPLSKDARSRVISYTFKRLGIATTSDAETVTAALTAVKDKASVSVTSRVVDIRTLKEEKQPSSSREMAVLVAYYLSELAPLHERKSEITAEDIRQYFKQAGFALPRHPDMTLVHTKNAGYLDAGSGRGYYRLNPVGYNLIVHSLPTGTDRQSRQPIRRRKKTTKVRQRRAETKK